MADKPDWNQLEKVLSTEECGMMKDLYKRLEDIETKFDISFDDITKYGGTSKSGT
jgi:chromatin remodeling complex protein RSC6